MDKTSYDGMESGSWKNEEQIDYTDSKLAVEDIDPTELLIECSAGNCRENATHKIMYAGHESFACSDAKHLEKNIRIAKYTEDARNKNTEEGRLAA